MSKLSILRYPGSKSKIYDVVKKIIKDNGLSSKTYCEPFAGGFGCGLQLLVNRDVNKVIINDLDRHIYSFWVSIFNFSDELIKKIKETEITIVEWKKQKKIYEHTENHSLCEVGFSTLFLNRTNFSGILTAGPLGGFSQKGKYKLNCRFNKEKVIESIEEVSKYKDKVEVYNLDFLSLIFLLKNRENEMFYNFDPPYVEKGHICYEQSFNTKQHYTLFFIAKLIRTDWIMTYDNSKFIIDLYRDYNQSQFSIFYSAGNKLLETELMISNFLSKENLA